tara:strand:- start:105 stop:305 length:201 start_codon:yes stop_codon:yes gene_type:complete
MVRIAACIAQRWSRAPVQPGVEAGRRCALRWLEQPQQLRDVLVRLQRDGGDRLRACVQYREEDGVR